MILYGHNETVYDVTRDPITEENIWGLERAIKHFGLAGKRIVDKFNIVLKEMNGWVPLSIESLPDGTWCPAGTPFSQISNTVKDFGELVTWWEPRFLHMAFASGTATEAFHMRQYLLAKQKEYQYDDSFLWKFHSFGWRGHRSIEDGYWAGTAWNLFLHGTDDLHTSEYTPNAKIGSIPALAHKVTQQFDDEFECLRHAIMVTHQDGLGTVAEVIDTYDAYRVINEYLVTLAAIARTKKVHLVLRPDSGDTWEQTVLIWRKCRELNINNVSVIIGEGMSFENAKKADAFFESHGIPPMFVFYGVGGGFYNHINRDTLGWAMKTAFSNGKDRMKFGMTQLKRSIPGRVDIIRNSYTGNLEVVPRDEESVLHTQYMQSYYFDPAVQGQPAWGLQTWDGIQQLALTQSAAQDIIRISPEINDKVEEFRKQYLGGR